MKISDAGPSNQRIDPLQLGDARKSMLKDGTLVKIERQNAHWFHLKETPSSQVKERLAILLPIYRRTTRGEIGKRVGQCLEIAVFKALCQQQTMEFLGDFNDLNDHDDTKLYSKTEPPSAVSGRTIAPRSLDFITIHSQTVLAGIEAKNVREWQYPNREEIKELLSKCCSLDIVPVLIARRIPFVTFKLLHACGAVVHQTYNQLFPSSESALADEAKDKNLLGYHDIRVGNEPDARLLKFIAHNLPDVLPGARDRFDEYKDLVEPFSNNNMSYEVFAARVRRRAAGTNEDSDWEGADSP
jgi:hypothetical protein